MEITGRGRLLGGERRRLLRGEEITGRGKRLLGGEENTGRGGDYLEGKDITGRRRILPEGEGGVRVITGGREGGVVLWLVLGGCRPIIFQDH